MMVKKISQEATPALVVEEDELVDSEENKSFTDLCNKLAEIRKNKSVIGYIIRNETSATIDLKETEKIFEYAIFSSQVLDSSQEISDLFELGDVRSVLIEGKESNVLCMNLDGNKISIFMEKDADQADILKKISP
jgi:predicted regulator of Ras-like GTPase activity (Roadblock/LC7/MglB family)